MLWHMPPDNRAGTESRVAKQLASEQQDKIWCLPTRVDRQRRRKREAVMGTGKVAVIRKVTREDKAATQLFPIQVSAESIAIPGAHLSFKAAFSRIGGHLPLTRQDGTNSDQGSLRVRRAADAAVAAQCDDAARVGRRFRRLNARRAQPFLSGRTSQGKISQECEDHHRREFRKLLRT